MSRSDDYRLDDMREMCTLVGRGRAAFEEDPAIVPAIERALEVLGEAAGHVSDERRKAFQSIPWRDIVGMRVRLAHHHRS